MKQVFIFIFCISACITVHAQFSVGPKAGLNLSRISFSSRNFTSGIRPFFYAGGFASYHLSKQWTGQLEILYSGEGTTEKSTTQALKGHISEGYIQVPLLVQYHSKFGLFAETGPQLGFLFSSKESFNGNKEDIKKYYKTTDFRWPIGIGYAFANEKLMGLGVNMRYSFSFSQINKVTVGGESLKNNVLSIGVFYKIPAGKKWASHK